MIKKKKEKLLSISDINIVGKIKFSNIEENIISRHISSIYKEGMIVNQKKTFEGSGMDNQLIRNNDISFSNFMEYAICSIGGTAVFWSKNGKFAEIVK